MKKELLLGALIVYAPLTSAKDLLEIKITSGIRSEQREVTTPNQITVISQEDIVRSGATTITDVLRGRAGLQITDLRGDGASTTVSVRGFAQTANANVLILVDGRRLNYSDTRNPDISHIALSDVEQIEVTQGSAGVLYGNQAVGGVVNIITRKPGRKLIRTAADVGSYGRRSARFNVSNTLDNGLAYRLSAEALRSDGYREHSSRDFRNLSGHLSYAYDSGRVFVDVQQAEDDLELPGALVQAEFDADRRSHNAGFVDDFSDSTTDVVRLGLQQSLGQNWMFEGEATYRETDSRLTQSFQNFPSPPGGQTSRNQVSLNPRLIGNFDTSRGDAKLTLGIDAEQTDFNLYIPVNFFGVSVTNRKNDQDTEALYAQAVVPVMRNVDMTFGGRHASVDNDIVDDGTFGNFRNGIEVDDNIFVRTLGVNYRPDNAWRIYARLDENFRFAKVDEITNAASGDILKTQEGLSSDVGVEWSGADKYFNFGLYRLELENEIYFDPIAFVNVNLDKTVRRGLVASGGMLLTDKLSLSGDFTYTHAKFADGALDGQYVSGVAPRIATLRLGYRPDERWDVLTELQLISSKYAQGDNLNSRERAPGYGLVNLAARYAHKNMELAFKVNNLTDKEYSESIIDGFTRGYQPSPERNFLVTLGYRFH